MKQRQFFFRREEKEARGRGLRLLQRPPSSGFQTGDEHPDWDKLGADYFIAPWEKRGFAKKKALKTPADGIGK